jgi:hypothetical protein
VVWFTLLNRKTCSTKPYHHYQSDWILTNDCLYLHVWNASRMIFATSCRHKMFVMQSCLIHRKWPHNRPLIAACKVQLIISVTKTHNQPSMIPPNLFPNVNVHQSNNGNLPANIISVARRIESTNDFINCIYYIKFRFRYRITNTLIVEDIKFRFSTFVNVVNPLWFALPSPSWFRQLILDNVKPCLSNHHRHQESYSIADALQKKKTKACSNTIQLNSSSFMPPLSKTQEY